MENIAPPLVLLWEAKRALEKGQGVRVGIKSYLKRGAACVFRHQVEIWWAAQNNSQILYDKSSLSPARRYLLEVLEAGLKGHGILQALYGLESELILSCEDEIQNHISRLPLLALIPLMFLIFPALMLLLIVPLLKLLQF
ncbi:MAG: hypothetical protein AABY53_06585 [Bdellovibrionota bacterium]